MISDHASHISIDIDDLDRDTLTDLVLYLLACYQRTQYGIDLIPVPIRERNHDFDSQSQFDEYRPFGDSGDHSFIDGSDF